MDRQVCVIITVTYSLWTDRQTDRQTEARTDKKVKTGGPMILSNDIFNFKTVMFIGGPTVISKITLQ